MFNNAIPDEVSLHVVSFFGTKELGISAQVSKKWKIISEDESIWKRKIAKDFGVDIPDNIPHLLLPKKIYHHLEWHKKLAVCFSFGFPYAQRKDITYAPIFLCKLPEELKEELYNEELKNRNEIDKRTMDEDDIYRSYSSLIEGACCLGNIHLAKDLAEFLVNGKENLIDQRCFSSAALSGNLELVQWLVNTYGFIATPDDDTLDYATWTKNHELVNWLVEKFQLSLPEHESPKNEGGCALLKC